MPENPPGNESPPPEGFYDIGGEDSQTTKKEPPTWQSL